MKPKEVFALLGRYLVLVILAVSGLSAIYLAFTPITLYPVFFILKAFYGPELSLNGISIFLNEQSIKLIPACIGGAAYFLLFALNLSTPMHHKLRLKSIFFTLGAFLSLNIIRIAVLSFLALSGNDYFDFTHKASWYLGSTLFVILIWFGNVAIFKIKEIPFYTDVRSLARQVPKRL